MGHYFSYTKNDNEPAHWLYHARNKVVPKAKSMDHLERYLSPLSRHGMTHSKSFDSILCLMVDQKG